MKSDRASDLHLVRGHQVEAGGCAPPVVLSTRRQQEQAFVERQRADYYARADSYMATRQAPVNPAWDDVVL